MHSEELLERITEKLYGDVFVYENESVELPFSIIPTQNNIYPEKNFNMADISGYYGLWSVIDNKLCLVDLIGLHERFTELPIFAKWFTGEIRIPKNDEKIETNDFSMTIVQHKGCFPSLRTTSKDYYSKEQRFYFEKGVLKTIINFDSSLTYSKQQLSFSLALN